MERRVVLLVMIGAMLSNTANSQDQKAVEILESMQKRYEQSTKDVEDYILDKGNHTIFYKKAYTEDGRPYFKSKFKGDMESDSATNLDRYSQFSSQAKEKATYEGTDEVDGNDVHVIYIDQMEVEGINVNRDREATVEDIYLYVDSDKLVVRKMEYTTKSQIKGEKGSKMSPVFKNRDFRNVEGMLIPFETTTVVKGLSLSEEEREEVEEGLKDFEEKLDEMPESQRAMMEEMAGDKIEKYRNMIEEDQYKQVSQVKNVEVNTGMEMDDF